MSLREASSRAVVGLVLLALGLVVLVGILVLTGGRVGGAGVATAASPTGPGSPELGLIARARALAASDVGIHKIKHVVIIMQENHSFDNYFGTYPGAYGIPGLAGNPGHVPCLKDPMYGGCDKPYHEITLEGIGGGHAYANAKADVDGGKMDGFVTNGEGSKGVGGTPSTDKAACRLHRTDCVDVMGYYNQQEIPNYWSYARHFVLQDHMFEPALSWSMIAHLYMVSGWSAQCANSHPASCKTDIDSPNIPPSLNASGAGEAFGAGGGGVSPANPAANFAWTDITYLLHEYHVSWKYYIELGAQPDCDDGAIVCKPQPQLISAPSIWNPMPNFVDVRQDKQLRDIVPTTQIFTDAKNGALPAVSWVIPSQDDSEHPPANIAAGQDYVTNIVNAIMRSKDWRSTAIFLAWDDWGGYYDNIVPPKVDRWGYGIRVPALVISPYARRGLIDHQTLSFDAYLKFIEDDFLGGQALNPKTDGRWDPRPDVREDEPILGNLVSEFDFHKAPRPPLILNPNPSGEQHEYDVPQSLGTAGSNPLTPYPQCPRDTGTIGAVTLGPVRLDLTRAAQRRDLPHYEPTPNPHFDDVCLAIGHPIRVGYLNSRAALAMTANTAFTYDRVSPGTRLRTALRDLHGRLSGPFSRGANVWYASTRSRSTLFIEASEGRVSEIGIAARSLAATPSQQRELLAMLGA